MWSFTNILDRKSKKDVCILMIYATFQVQICIPINFLGWFITHSKRDVGCVKNCHMESWDYCPIFATCMQWYNLKYTLDGKIIALVEQRPGSSSILFIGYTGLWWSFSLFNSFLLISKGDFFFLRLLGKRIWEQIFPTSFNSPQLTFILLHMLSQLLVPYCFISFQ